MMGAPYRFARANRWVHFPDWARHVSHDVPFKDGWCGTIRFDIEAMTPLLVGGARTHDQAPGEVWPVRLPDGRYAIPPSSLQGMVRAILSVAAFGKLGGRVDDRRFAVRDLSGTTTSKLLFQARLTSGHGTGVDPYTPTAKAGWLMRKGSDVRIVPCAVARMRIADLSALPQVTSAVRQILEGRRPADERLRALKQVLPGLALHVEVEQVTNHPHTPGLIRYSRCAPSATGGVAGTVVLTGKPQPGIQAAGAKKLEFVFHTPDRAGAKDTTGTPLPKDVWRDFLDIHDPPKGSGRKINPNWAYWKNAFEAGEPVPVFYLEEGGRITAMGTAFMFKAAMPLSTHDLLRNSSADHFERALDLPSLLFGAVEGDHDAMSLKRRASFGFGVAASRPGLEDSRVALSSPKPAFYPNYVRQHPHAGARIPAHLPYAAYTSYPGITGLGSARERPELAGTKLYPARGGTTQQQQYPDAVSTLLHALPAGTTFPNIPLRVHNLRTVEVGALLWALCFGQVEHLAGMESPLRHRLGMGKPLGLGEIRIGNVRLALDANDGSETLGAAAFIQAFVDHMNAHYPGGQWQESVQVKALLKAANPEAQHGGLTYHGSYEGYSQARATGHFLPDYVQGHEIARPAGQMQAQGGPAPPPPGRIVTDRSPPNLSRLGLLEDEHDRGRDFSALLANLLNQARNWPDADRRVFAALCHGKLKLSTKVNSQLKQRIENMFPASD